MTAYPIVASRATTSLGDIPGALFDRLLGNESGLRPIPDYRFDASYKNALNSGACIIEQTPEFWSHPQQGILNAYVVPFMRELLASVERAGVELPRDRVGVSIGTSVGTSHELAAAVRFKRQPPARAGFSKLLRDICADVGISGPMSIVSTACTAGATSIIRGIHYLRSMQADLVICGGFDFFSELTHTGFNSLRAMTSTSCRPFSTNREGMILGDGVGLLAIVRGDDARFEGLSPMASVCGYAMGADNYHDTSPQPTGETLARLMMQAWADAGQPPVSYVNAHGTATEANDQAEANALQIFAAKAGQKRILVSSIKGHIGHTLGAAGAVEAIVTALSLQRGIAPGNFGLDEAIATDPTIVLVREPESLPPGTSAMSVSLAFGGHIAVLVLNPAMEH
jgi:3-oxoacyl-[acyl-carrier-protein] synthase II